RASLFFFSRYAHHRALPSFPTRRSSDLRADAPWSSVIIASPRPDRARDLDGVDAQERVARCHEHRFRSPLARHGDALRYRGLGRSEEHTSELQSRENLVCRLLLEKKKNK